MQKILKKFDCGCEWEVAVENDNIIAINYEPEKAPLDCPKVMELLRSGLTKGIFQLETPLGQSTTKVCSPRTIEELSDVNAILRPGCISGDTTIARNIRSRHKYDLGKVKICRSTIRNLYNNRNRLYYSISLNENTGLLFKNNVKGIIYSGDKEVFRVVYQTIKAKHYRDSTKFTRHYNLECTLDHQLLTPYGWKALQDFKEGDRFAVKRMHVNMSDGNYKNDYYDSSKTYKLICQKAYEVRCIFCDWQEASLDINHIDSNRENNHYDNLCFMCPNHHRMFTEKLISIEEVIQAKQKYRLPSYEDIIWGFFLRAESVGIKDTYDMQMEGPHHNFLAGNIIVHNCGDAMLENKTLKQHYIDRKNGVEEPTPLHPSLGNLLESTQNIGIYQESYISISKNIAGFSAEHSVDFLKCIAKKNVEKMASYKDKFITGCMSHSKMSLEDATSLFEIVEAGQRYAFNKSHSISYALDAIYFGAYAKAHFPRAFFLAELVYAKDIEEIGAVIDDSLNFNIEVCKPDLRLMNDEFTLTNRCIQYGLGRIKGCGEAKLKKLVEAIDNRNVSEMCWPELMLCLSKTGSDAAYALIYAGALDFTLLTRTKMAFELSIFNRLNEKQQRYVVERKSLSNALTEMLEMGSGKTTLCYNKRSLAALELVINEFNKPPKSMRDTPNQIFDWEMQYMGYAFTTSEVDESIANCTCHDFVEGKTLKEYTLVGTVSRIKLILTKGKQPGQEMAFVEFKDSTNKVSGVMFPKQWLEYRQKLFEGNKLMFIGVRGNGNKHDSLIINRVMQL